MKMSNNMQRMKMSNNMQRFKIRRKDINQSSEGRAHCRNAIRIEIPMGKLQRIQGRIMFIEIVLRSSRAEDIMRGA
jgi:hypothetical protein